MQGMHGIAANGQMTLIRRRRIFGPHRPEGRGGGVPIPTKDDDERSLKHTS